MINARPLLAIILGAPSAATSMSKVDPGAVSGLEAMMVGSNGA
ncbi:MAG TPA: hypothetical protein VFZ74_02150 [Burkholderiales bacterium]